MLNCAGMKAKTVSPVAEARSVRINQRHQLTIPTDFLQTMRDAVGEPDWQLWLCEDGKLLLEPKSDNEQA